jgi:hypothetical protein
VRRRGGRECPYDEEDEETGVHGTVEKKQQPAVFFEQSAVKNKHEHLPNEVHHTRGAVLPKIRAVNITKREGSVKSTQMYCSTRKTCVGSSALNELTSSTHAKFSRRNLQVH